MQRNSNWSKETMESTIIMNETARQHIEAALQFATKEEILQFLTSAPEGPKRRGRPSGAATSESRCHWKFPDASQCKNAKQGQNSYCKMHISKIHLIDGSV